MQPKYDKHRIKISQFTIDTQTMHVQPMSTIFFSNHFICRINNKVAYSCLAGVDNRLF